MKSKVILATVLFSMMSSAYAAKELSREDFGELAPFKEIHVTKPFNSIGDAVSAISAQADKEGADYFYINDLNYNPKQNTTDWSVSARLYKKNAKWQPDQGITKHTNGVLEYADFKARRFIPFETIHVKGYFPVDASLTNKVANEAKEKGAYAFYIQQVTTQSPQDDNDKIATALLFKKDAPLSPKIGHHLNNPLKVTFPDGKQVRQLISIDIDDEMKPLKEQNFSGVFNNFVDVTQKAASLAHDAGARYFFIKGLQQDDDTNKYDVTVQFFK